MDNDEQPDAELDDLAAWIFKALDDDAKERNGN